MPFISFFMSEQFLNADKKSRVNSRWNRIVKGIEIAIFLRLKLVNIYNLFCRIYNPVFADTCCAVFNIKQARILPPLQVVR